MAHTITRPPLSDTRACPTDVLLYLYRPPPVPPPNGYRASRKFRGPREEDTFLLCGHKEGRKEGRKETCVVGSESSVILIENRDNPRGCTTRALRNLSLSPLFSIDRFVETLISSGTSLLLSLSLFFPFFFFFTGQQRGLPFLLSPKNLCGPSISREG